MKVTHLRVNHLENPMGYALERPVFSWVVTDTGSQKPERVQLSVRQGDRCVYDSGPSAALDPLGTQLPVELLPRTRYTWRVTVWGDGGDRGESGEARFETGKRDEPWLGRWIRGEGAENGILERSFSLPEAPESARIYLSGLGLYRLLVNGLPASGEVLTPAQMAVLVREISRLGNPPLFVEPQYTDLSALTLSRETGSAVWSLDPMVTGPEETVPLDYYETVMLQNMETLIEALSAAEN